MNERVLLIDDDATLRLAIADVLELLGYTVTACSEENFHQALYLPYDIILCDHNLGTMMGTDVHNIVKTFPHIAKIPFLVLTGYTDDVLKEYSGLTKHNVLTKPFPIHEFEQRIKSLVALS